MLCKAISGVLQSQGFCVIIGSDTLYVSRVRFTPLYLQAPTFVFLGFQLLHTLALFVPDELRWCCLRMYRHKFSPYVRLQVVHRVREILALRLRPILRSQRRKYGRAGGTSMFSQASRVFLSPLFTPFPSKCMLCSTSCRTSCNAVRCPVGPYVWLTSTVQLCACHLLTAVIVF